MILAGVLGLYIGFKLNEYANKKSEERIIDILTQQINQLQEKLQLGKISMEEQTKIQGLEEALRILKTKS